MALERDPNSSNLFYVEPELFPITNEVEEAGNDKVYLDEETGKFIFEFPTLYPVWIPVDLGEDISNKRFILWVEKGIAQSALAFTTIIEGTSVQTIDPNFSDFLIDTPSGERFYGYYVETESHGSSGEITFIVHPDTDFGSSPLGMALTHDDYVMSEWQSAYREAKIDLDPALSSKLITVGQLSRLKGSGTASGAQADKLVTMSQLARLTGKQAPAEDKKSKLVTVGQAYSVV